MKAIDKNLVARYWTDERKFQLIGKKKLLLLPWLAPEVLVTMDLMNPEGSLTRSQTKKLLQVNHMLQLLRPTLDTLVKQFPLIRIAEGAAGNSYVSLLLAWYFTDVTPHPVMIIASDSNPKVVAQSEARSKALGFDRILRSAVEPLAGFDWAKLHTTLFPEHLPADLKAEDAKKIRPNLFVTLHACDALSCQAIHHGMILKADHLAIAPCCQAQLAAQWKEALPSTSPLRAIFASPNIRRSAAADFTDTIRLLLLRSLGYEGEAIEFVPSEHTPKNRLILVQRKRQFDLDSLRAYRDLKAEVSEGRIELEKLLENELTPFIERL
ncbi:MAG: methyltransferase [Bdellovibrionota bacterium]